MSMQSWTVTGWGVKAEPINEVELNDKIWFIKRFLPKVYEEMQSEGESDSNADMSNTSDYLDFCSQ